MSALLAYLYCGRCHSTRTAPLSRLSTCPYCRPPDATPRPVSRRDVTLLHGERELGA